MPIGRYRNPGQEPLLYGLATYTFGSLFTIFADSATNNVASSARQPPRDSKRFEG